jgi:RNA polymerase sigma-70 factor (ECF subfamily)
VDGDIEACIRSEYRRLVGAVTLVTGSVTTAEDAVQEAFARAWERSRRGEGFTHLAGWVATVALNEARGGHRRRRTEERALVRLAGRPTEGPAVDEVSTRVALHEAVAALAPRQREAVVLHHLLDVDVATTANLLGVSEGTVKSALHRARAHLAEALTEREEMA